MKHLALALLALTGCALAQDNKGASVASPARDNSVEAELASFEVAQGYEVRLFASEELGIANPIAMRWGPRGRLWVLCTLVYPQIIPTDPPQDKLYILEDVDQDGRADKAHVFADGLDMPTGFALGNGGVYLGQGPDLLFLTDRDGDDRADTREVLLSGFGTGDTHQNINSFTWSPGGELLFGQGLHNFSRVETPWGIVRMDEHGVWRLRPKRRQLHAFRGCSGQNPWGLSFGQWGEPFAKSNNTEVSELLPVMVHTENRHRPLDIGATRVKSMICEIVDSPALPDDLQGNIIIAGYFAHIVDRLKITTDGSGHKGELLAPLFRTNLQSFRPVDVQTGPDGALYVADWYNPIIGHYQASLRHPDRDKVHGRIWRVTAKGMKTGKAENLATLSTRVLLKRLETAPLKERERIRITLSHRDGKIVLEEVAAWIRGLDQSDARYEHHLFEALALFEWNETVNRPLLELLLSSKNPLARAYATRVVGRWHDRLADPLKLLENSVRDPHPRVRLEAVVAASQVGSSTAMQVAALALDAPMDRFLDAALRQCTHALREHWFPALREGTLGMSDARHLAFLLTQSTGRQAAQAARQLLEGSNLGIGSEAFPALATVLATQGTAGDLAWLVEIWEQDAEKTGPVLAALVESAALRDLKPAVAKLPALLDAAIKSASQNHRVLAIRLMGLWKIEQGAGDLARIAGAADESSPVRAAAVESLGRLRENGNRHVDLIAALASKDKNSATRRTALATLAGLDLARAATIAARQISQAGPDEEVEQFVVPFLARKEGDAALAVALTAQPPAAKIREKIRAVLGAAGRHSPALAPVLAPPAAANTIGLPPYDEKFVRDLAFDVKKSGDSKRGSDVYHRDSLSCTMCHVIDFCGRNFGPELSAVGAGLPVELIIESVVWPRRQVKEGFLSTTITTKSGRVVSGHLQREDKQRIVIRDVATQSDQTIAPAVVATRQDAGTIMPPGLTAGLTREELRDLVRFLSERKGAKPPAP